MDSEIEKVIDDSEKVVEKEDLVQEGGARLNTSIYDDFLVGEGNSRSVLQLWNIINDYQTRIGSKVANGQKITDSSGAPFINNGANINDKPLLLSDLFDLLNPNSAMSAIFSIIPLAQYKHLPDPNYLLQNSRQAGGDMDESSLPKQEVSLPNQEISLPNQELSLPNQEVSLPNEPKQELEEQLPSLDIVEPRSTGGSYKWSSHKKRKSTRIRTKKNKSKK